MKSKKENWLEELYPGHTKLISEYQHLTPRELPIVAAAVLDAALEQILKKRLQDCPKEFEEFFGTDGDGRAPAASFGAKIQLAVLTGVFTPEYAKPLKAIKNIRNKISHQAKLTLTSPEIALLMRQVFDFQMTGTEGMAKRTERGKSNGHKKLNERALQLKALRPSLGNDVDFAREVLLWAFATQQSFLHDIAATMKCVGPAPPPKR